MKIKIRDHIYDAELTDNFFEGPAVELITENKRHAVGVSDYEKAGCRIASASAEELAGMVAAGFSITMA